MPGEGEDLAETGISVAPIQGQEAAGSATTELRKKRRALPPEFRKKFRLQDEDDTLPVSTPLPRDDRLPGLDLLVNEQNPSPR